ncbi:MAG: polyprenol monophosphomannose synthase [Crenarchaeota archaeon]|nr:polyprenol monophosphomannose synthase [Thermoproteota archaeon]MDA1124833.1 polyprenol monophosphomannose synthase [Thermoproteota archaeon]
MKLAIVIPTYNEAETIPSLIKELFEKIKQLVEKLDILIIDDSSPDGTADIARELGEKYEKITVIKRPKKMGLGAAYKEGFRHVLERLDSELVLQMDADHSHQPSEIPNMLEKINNFDFLIASRHVEGSDVIGWGIGRKVTHSIAGTIARICARIEIKDSTSGFRMFKKKTLEKIDFNKIRSDGFAFQIEVLYQLKQLGMKGLEVPTIFVNRTEGSSKMGRIEMMQFITMCISYIGRK